MAYSFEDVGLRAAATAAGLVALWTLETWRPAVDFAIARGRHAGRNLALGAANALVVALLLGPPLAAVVAWGERSDAGLLRAAGLGGPAAAIVGFLLLDVWMYAWHRASHEVPFLWRFHRVHHSDTAMDVTTAVRFHAGEVAMSAAARLALVPLLGLSLWHLLVYDIALQAVVQFHHSNVALPDRLDRALRLAIVSPAIHRVHHSRERVEHDSNYASVLSLWDRVARSYTPPRRDRELRYGLPGIDGVAWESVVVLLRMPFARKARPSRAPKR